jgi:hypothetical protein
MRAGCAAGGVAGCAACGVQHASALSATRRRFYTRQRRHAAANTGGRLYGLHALRCEP